jgi:arabinose-5-phosphate isomerase
VDGAACLEWARAALLAESGALRAAAERLGEELVRAVELIVRHPGKVIVTGLGKSGHVARKIAATLASTGTPAVFLHAADAAHGDLGVYQAGDPTLLLSKSGATAELVALAPVLRGMGSPLIGILGDLRSPLAREVDVALDARVEREADPFDLAPTSSSTLALALGDALAVTLLRARGFTPADFARFHPNGQLGRALLLSVRDVMHAGDEVAWAAPEDPLREVIIAMTRRPLGAACVRDASGRLAGLITDGDVRRALETHDDIRALRARDVMTARPVTVAPEALLREAIRLMENRPSQISVLPVVDAAENVLGLVRIHDVYQAGL